MTYEAREISAESGAPVELYIFRVYDVNYYYTSAATDQVVEGITYIAYPIDRSEFEETDQLPKNDLTLTCSLDFPSLAFYDNAPPSDVILLTVKRWHRDDNEVIPPWSGRVLNGKRIRGE